MMEILHQTETSMTSQMTIRPTAGLRSSPFTWYKLDANAGGRQGFTPDNRLKRLKVDTVYERLARLLGRQVPKEKRQYDDFISID